MPRMSTMAQAMSNPARHAFHPGVGYVEFLPHEQMLHGGAAPDACFPAGPTLDGSLHLLTSPGGPEMEFVWVARDQAWARFGGNRLAWTAAYLSSHGWTYKGPVPDGAG
jgi:hypothetical protein